eukprot:CAMPEP_0170921424 /NCGR_PEP_ID=MMETSP0735-20130129/9822_1 /TAXON_ID=186038 /ORGANISM="Fragilariopsis kerguelensis, Strain L26-C5" /LENGTH=65 /DNA_ID=CAMNT_0011320595 /DNA_START=431 /DNA_END=628 /DNA_ORIENTATION=+
MVAIELTPTNVIPPDIIPYGYFRGTTMMMSPTSGCGYLKLGRAGGSPGFIVCTMTNHIITNITTA